MFPALDVALGAGALGAGVQHFVLLSLQGADKLTITPHAQLEKQLGGNGAMSTFLRPSFFMQNLTTTHLPELKTGIIAVPAGNGRTSFVDAGDVAEAAAIVLTEGGHENRAYELTGPAALTYREVAEIFTRVTGHLYRYISPNPVAFYRLMRGQGAGRAETLVMEAIYATARLGLAKHVSEEFLEQDAGVQRQDQGLTAPIPQGTGNEWTVNAATVNGWVLQSPTDAAFTALGERGTGADVGEPGGDGTAT